jgi:hypothetical protein
MPPTQPQAPAYSPINCPVCTVWAAKERQHRKDWREDIIQNHPKKLLRSGAFPFCPPLCTKCGEQLPDQGYEQGRVMEGFKSFTINHYHLEDVAGVGARTAICDKMCFNCLLADWNKNYPDTEYGAAEE